MLRITSNFKFNSKFSDQCSRVFHFMLTVKVDLAKMSRKIIIRCNFRFLILHTFASKSSKILLQ